MRQYLLLSGIVALMMASDGVSAKNIERPALPEPIQQLQTLTKQAQLINKQNAAGQVWRPAKVQHFWWDGASWENGEDRVYTYFEDGKVKTASNPYSRTDYQYDEKGRLVKQLTYETVGEERLQNTVIFTYDTVVEDLIVKTETYNEWDTYISGIDITRNEAGNIILVRDFNTDQGQVKYQGDRLTITYGTDGKANTITQEYVWESEVEVETKLANIAWENTDGQIYELDVDLDDAAGDEDGIFFGANRIKSADVVDNFPGSAKLLCDYNADNVGFTGKMMLGDEVVSSVVFTPVDEYGSYDCETFAIDFDYDDETGTWERDGADREKTTYRVDKFGLVLLDMDEDLPVEEEEDELEKWGEKAIVTYDPVTGYPTEYIRQSYNDWDNQFTNQERTLYLDYSDVNAAAIETVEFDETAPAEYFNLQGIRVERPENGIYILRQGNKTSKVLVK